MHNQTFRRCDIHTVFWMAGFVRHKTKTALHKYKKWEKNNKNKNIIKGEQDWEKKKKKEKNKS